MEKEKTHFICSRRPRLKPVKMPTSEKLVLLRSGNVFLCSLSSIQEPVAVLDQQEMVDVERRECAKAAREGWLGYLSHSGDL